MFMLQRIGGRIEGVNKVRLQVGNKFREVIKVKIQIAPVTPSLSFTIFSMKKHLVRDLNSILKKLNFTS